MDSRSAPAWGEQRRVPVRAHGAQDGGGAGGPSTVKGKIWMGKKFRNGGFFLAAARWAGRCAERRVAWPWQRRQSFFYVVLCWQNVKICECLLATPSFQCIGAAVCRPRCLAGRWAGRRAERRVAWPWRRRRIFLLYRIVLAKR